MTFTTEQIVALAPDASSAKAGQGLANARHWVTLGNNEKAVWGECQGSGKNPYQTQIDVHEVAFKCSCPTSLAHLRDLYRDQKKIRMHHGEHARTQGMTNEQNQ